ncbi:MAG: SocA family protein [Leptolyngbyaceae cyanobacterium SM1_3_5]|nr:SocA family protein [Leptolyngbyaceae cyanobacterium SM1_3_5]
MLNCFDVANYFIWLANSTGSFVSNLKLQKLVYYAQAWHLALYGEPLFQEDFEAWVHGPVIPNLYHEYKGFGWKPIQKDVEKKYIKDTFDESTLAFLEEVAEAYFSYDAYALERMTHVESPWISARNGVSIDTLSCEVISKESMKEYYSSRAEED